MSSIKDAIRKCKKRGHGHRRYKVRGPATTRLEKVIRRAKHKELVSVVRFKAKLEQSYDAMREQVVQAFRTGYISDTGPYCYVYEVFPSYAIVEEGNAYYKAGYTISGADVTIADRKKWVKVRRVTKWDTKQSQASALTFKQTDENGNESYRWVLLSSNGFRDRDGELITTKALELDVAYWELSGKPAQPLRWWHVPLTDDYAQGLEIGTMDFRMMHGHTLIESGTFFTKEIGASVDAAQDKLSGSIGFRHSPNEPDSDKIINMVNIFERSLLPKESASNVLAHLIV